MESQFVQGAAVWTTKEVLIAFGSAAAVTIPAVLTLYRLLSIGLRQHVAVLTKQKLQLEARLSEASQQASLAAKEARARLDDAEKQLAEQMQSSLAREQEWKEADRRSQADLETSEAKFRAERKRIENAIGSDGLTWTERVRYGTPDFHPLDERRTPIISVLNLKGGVGKTTLAANLGAALDRRGWRVLMVDLDLQGSLTSLFLEEQDQAVLAEQRKLIGDFLERSFDAEYPNLLEHTAPILGSKRSALVGTVDTLAYAETNLTVRWLLREGTKDPRFILRRELHLRRISNRFDIILLDCPPLINVSCVNALAASDYVLVPVMPSKAAMDRVPVLLRRMLEFRNNINQHLKLMGLVANRTWAAELTSDEKNRLSELTVKGKNIWGEHIHLLETTIRQNAELRTAEDQHRPLAAGEAMAEAFDRLAAEVETCLPSFCRATPIPTTTPVKVTS